MHVGGSIYATGQFSNDSDTLLVTDIGCSQSDTSISQCTISHFTKISTCDVKDIAAVRCHRKLCALNCLLVIYHQACHKFVT